MKTMEFEIKYADPPPHSVGNISKRRGNGPNRTPLSVAVESLEAGSNKCVVVTAKRPQSITVLISRCSKRCGDGRRYINKRVSKTSWAIWRIA